MPPRLSLRSRKTRSSRPPDCARRSGSTDRTVRRGKGRRSRTSGSRTKRAASMSHKGVPRRRNRIPRQAFPDDNRPLSNPSNPAVSPPSASAPGGPGRGSPHCSRFPSAGSNRPPRPRNRRRRRGRSKLRRSTGGKLFDGSYSGIRNDEGRQLAKPQLCLSTVERDDRHCRETKFP